MTEEQVLIGANSEFPLNGLLTLPDNIDAENAVPAAVIVQGAGILDIDGSFGPNKPTKDIAEGLAERGIATIRYPKRSYMYTSVLLNALELTVREEIIFDAVAAAQYIKQDSRIDPKRVFMIGHDLGGSLAFRIHLEGGNFTGLAILAGTPRRAETALIDQTQEAVQLLKGPLHWIAKYQARKIKKNTDAVMNLSDDDAMRIDIIKPFSAYYYKEMGRFPVAKMIQKANIPVLILQGELDFQITIEHDFDEYRKILDSRKDVTFQLYPGLNHYFMPASGADIDQYKKEYKRSGKVDKQVLNDIASWIRMQTPKEIKQHLRIQAHRPTNRIKLHR
ncbi:MAG: dienelactone hydrolase family protein [Clostridiales Family XIII bacterium]|jgi:dienelactone hydrolase|nr:dienelactone hydrolase family protein [Clostridiales Family XIII bacterium]